MLSIKNTGLGVLGLGVHGHGFANSVTLVSLRILFMLLRMIKLYSAYLTGWVAMNTCKTVFKEGRERGIKSATHCMSGNARLGAGHD